MLCTWNDFKTHYFNIPEALPLHDLQTQLADGRRTQSCRVWVGFLLMARWLPFHQPRFCAEVRLYQDSAMGRTDWGEGVKILCKTCIYVFVDVFLWDACQRSYLSDPGIYSPLQPQCSGENFPAISSTQPCF